MEVGNISARSRYSGRVFWAPTWGTPCGIAEYTRHLAEALGEVTVTAASPAPADAAGGSGAPLGLLLHVQHEFGNPLDEDVARTARAVKRAGGRVVVTKHSVRREERHPGDAVPAADAGRTWEGEADALVALT